LKSENKKHRYDYAIVGAGAAGLMLANAMINDPFFLNTSIILLDRDEKKINDRTWCFWEKGTGEFDHMVSKKWNHIHFAGQTFSKKYAIAPYAYKMIQGIDFYRSLMAKIKACPYIHFITDEIGSITDEGNKVTITGKDGLYVAKQAFSSLFDYDMVRHQNKYPVLQQHFLGWFITTENPVFEKDTATYMDFSVPQNGQTRFMYVLPTSPTEALVEYTLFSEELLPKEAYETAIKEYIYGHLKVSAFTLRETEQGSIPMTCYDFREHQTPNIRYIGTAGGWAKPSTGYTFMSTARKIPKLLAHIKSGKPLDELEFKNKFWYYDLLFLDVLHQANAKGHTIFESLFKNRTPHQIFKFLDEQTNLWEDLGTIMASPKWPFTKALVKRLF
jgi:lycopene beta-cyclase